MVSRRRRSVPDPAEFQASDVAMSESLDRTETLALNYQEWIEDLCSPYLGDRCLELGSGLGYMTERLAKGRTVVASDLSEKNLALLRNRFESFDNVSVRRIDIDDFAPDEQFDSIVMLNVLEHIADDRGTLVKLRRALAPGGRVVLYVPAFMMLYSPQDRAIGHYRRYRKKPLLELLDDSGYEPLDARYVNSLGWFGWFFYCRVLRRQAVELLSVGALDGFILPRLRRIETRFPPPFGVSIFAVGRVR